MSVRRIPNPVISVVAAVIAEHYYNHKDLNSLFIGAGAPGDAPEGNCVNKCEQWLKRCNVDPAVDAFEVLGQVLENFMELPHRSAAQDAVSAEHQRRRDRVHEILEQYGYSYQNGGTVLGAGSGPASKSLRKLLSENNLPGVEKEFQRALSAVESDPAAGVTAACALLEALFKIYLEDNRQDLPAKQNIGDLFKAVRSHMRIDTSHVADDDLKRILSGLISVVDGIGSLRTHTGSAHGHGRKSYRIEPRHARLTINSAHSLAVFVIETWSQRSTGSN